jgi:gliding motility-associated lipoprotein GldH
MLKKLHFLGLLFCVVVALCSCNKGVIYQKYNTIPDNTWDMNSPLTFTVPITDTINQYNVYVNVRNADSYDFSNLYLFIDITAPNNATERDTMNCILADNSGKWLGEGLGDIWDNKILFKYNTRFRKGDYKFKITQAMRVNKLTEIMDVGLRVEQTPKQTN